jgi:3-phosphoglycerate kinase
MRKFKAMSAVPCVVLVTLALCLAAAQGTKPVAPAKFAGTEVNLMGKNGAISIIGGGDSAAAVEQMNLSDRMTHVSTGGGASLEFMEGKKFKAIDILDEK